MLKTSTELLAELGAAIRTRRVAQQWSQEEAAVRAGMGVRTWRRMEKTGQATVESLVQAAVALRCEETLALLFPAPAAASMNDLLARQMESRKPLTLARGRKLRSQL
jgi:transcriptional regulator with XRE-family HTH domain